MPTVLAGCMPWGPEMLLLIALVFVAERLLHLLPWFVAAGFGFGVMGYAWRQLRGPELRLRRDGERVVLRWRGLLGPRVTADAGALVLRGFTLDADALSDLAVERDWRGRSRVVAVLRDGRRVLCGRTITDPGEADQACRHLAGALRLRPEGEPARPR